MGGSGGDDGAWPVLGGARDGAGDGQADRRGDGPGASRGGAGEGADHERGDGQSSTLTTGADGGYIDPLVKPGIYQVSVSAPGFKTSVANDVRVTVATSTRLGGRGGGFTEQVVVTDVVPLVETQNATEGTVISGDEVVDLPLNGRNVMQLGTLIPGVSAPPAALGGAQGNATVGGFGDTTGSYNVNGQRNQSNNFLLDGAPNNDSFNSGFVFRPPPDAVEEFKIQTNSYEAQYGRNAGAIVDVITRSAGMRSTEMRGSSIACLTWRRRIIFRRRSRSTSRTSLARRWADRSSGIGCLCSGTTRGSG